MSRPGNDFTWSEWDGPEVAAAEIDSLISAIEAGDVRELDLSVLFAPTGPIQEVSVSSGWGREFLVLASRFDVAMEKLGP